MKKVPKVIKIIGIVNIIIYSLLSVLALMILISNGIFNFLVGFPILVISVTLIILSVLLFKGNIVSRSILGGIMIFFVIATFNLTITWILNSLELFQNNTFNAITIISDLIMLSLLAFYIFELYILLISKKIREAYKRK